LTEKTGDDPVLSSLTHEGSVVGTPDYIAPEQARNSHLADIRSDLYSLGATFYFLLTGQPPFPEGSAVEKLLMHQLDDPQPVDELRPDVPPGVAVVIRKLMAKSPDHRFQQPAELADALSAWGVPASTKAPAKTMPITSERPISTAIVDVAGSAPVAPPTPLSSSQAPTMVQPPGSIFPPISVADTPSQVAAP